MRLGRKDLPTPFATVAALVTLVAVLGAGPVLTAGPASATTPSATPNEGMVAVGDSVPRGAHCGCSPFPQLYGRDVAAHTGHPVSMANFAVSGATSSSVLGQVRAWGPASAVQTSAVVLVMVGANDFEVPFERVLHHQQRAARVFNRVAQRVRTNVIAIIDRLRALHPGIRIVVLDYWNVVKDGSVGRRTYGPWGMSKAVQATSYANAALREAATDTRVTYVSTLREFKGPDGTSDPTRLLASDGDHPNARGQAVIARGVDQVDPTG